MEKLSWKPWHEVLELREDLRSGEMPMHLFAADLYEVMMQDGKRPIYEKPEHFFALTFPTYNLRQLVRDVALRLLGKNDKAVRQLELTYGGGKTHTLITLRHLVNEPGSLPDAPSVSEFVQAIGQKPPKCRIACLCFDKLDVEKGMAVRDPEGKVRTLKNPWSILAFQIAGDNGLKLLHADGEPEERESAPAENLLTELLAMPAGEELGTLILIDEVLMYAREKSAQDGEWRGKIANFFQYLTQAATKVDRCCIVASLLATDPRKSDTIGREIQAELYDIFQRQREEAVEPVVKEDVAEVLRRRFFTPASLKDREAFRQHVLAAIKGIAALDEQTAQQGPASEERFLRSFPFHPDLTEVLYSKWTQLSRFQRTRGVLRTFALALREAEKWDTSPLIGPAVFLPAPDKEGLSEALREMVAVADTEEWEGKKQAWTGILDNDFNQAKEIQKETTGLKNREIEQAVVATFLHSQPIGQNAHTRDLKVLIGSVRPDKIELEKGLARWAQSSYWLDDQFTAMTEGQLPSTWRLGNRPNLTQMHAVAAKNISEDLVRARLIDEIGKQKSLSANAAASGVRVHTLPSRPKDIEDDGLFHYAVLGPEAASESGTPSQVAMRFLDETTNTEKPRVYRNALVLLTPSKDGLEFAMARVRDYLAWETVREDVKRQQREGDVDPARAQTLQINIDKSKGRIPDAIRQAYCIVVTISDKNEPIAFKASITEDSHFNIIKADKRSRIQETPITADALLPDGPYNLWRAGEISRRVKDLAGAFAQLPHLPKMIKSKTILDTLADGCEKGIFVLHLKRPDGTARSWWMSRPDENALNDPALELWLNEGAEILSISPSLLAPGRIPELWSDKDITVKRILDFFGGSTTISIDRDGYKETLQVPKIAKEPLETSICEAVEAGLIWIVSGPASFLGEKLPFGVMTETSLLCPPPLPIAAAEILPENLPGAWKDGKATALSVAMALTVNAGKTLPWKIARDAINSAVSAHFLELEPGPQTWPCDYPSAQFVNLKVFNPQGRIASPGGKAGTGTQKVINTISVDSEIEPAQIMDLGDVIPKLLDIKTKTNTPMRFRIHIELGSSENRPSPETLLQINNILKGIHENLEIKE